MLCKFLPFCSIDNSHASIRRSVHCQVVASHLLEKGCPRSGRVTRKLLRKEALYRLAARSWNRKEIGKGRILERVIEAIEINEPRRRTKNNLVDWPNRYGHQAKKRQLGKLAQEVALQSERKRLVEEGHPNPNVVEPVWKEWKRGYDILSCDVDGKARHIEVKSARKSGRQLSFFLSAHEWKKSRKLQNYYFYLVLNASSSKPRVLTIKASQLHGQHLKAASFLAAFVGSS